MKWRHWSILIVLVLMNYIIFSTAFTLLAKQRQPGPNPTRTPWPTFEKREASPIGWQVLPTSTRRPTRVPVTPTWTPTVAPTAEPTTAADVTATSTTPVATESPPTPTPSPTAETISHTIKRGDTLSEIAARYGVAVEEIMEANGLTDPGQIITGQKLIVPVPALDAPTATASVQPSNTPKPTATRKPKATKAPAPTATRKPPKPSPTATSRGVQFTAEVIWDPMVAPNCGGPGIAKQSLIRDTSGNPINGVRVEVDCYGNKWKSRPSGTPGEYDAGHYDSAFGQSHPVDWTCTARVFDQDGQPVASTEVVSIHFDTNDCRPGGKGHQVAIVNWTKRW
jgi:LysM repeat protein